MNPLHLLWIIPAVVTITLFLAGALNCSRDNPVQEIRRYRRPV